MPLFGLILYLVLIGVVLYLLELIPMDGTIRQIVRLLVILAVILWLLSALGIFSMGPYIRMR